VQFDLKLNNLQMGFKNKKFYANLKIIVTKVNFFKVKGENVCMQLHSSKIYNLNNVQHFKKIWILTLKALIIKHA
jgi:hypothetical protein